MTGTLFLLPDLLFRLNVAALAGDSGGVADARNLLQGDLDLYAAQNRNLSQLLELNEKKNKYRPKLPTPWPA